MLLLLLVGMTFLRVPTMRLIERLAQDKADEFVHEMQLNQPTSPPTLPSATSSAAH